MWGYLVTVSLHWTLNTIIMVVFNVVSVAVHEVLLHTMFTSLII